jgi:hypothetical protein
MRVARELAPLDCRCSRASCLPPGRQDEHTTDAPTIDAIKHTLVARAFAFFLDSAFVGVILCGERACTGVCRPSRPGGSSALVPLCSRISETRLVERPPLSVRAGALTRMRLVGPLS